jgi:anhydro-N-acetylmuramic acid kinase
MSQLYIGLMSGTSMDAIDAVLVDFSVTPFNLLATHSHKFPDTVQQSLHELCTISQDEINKCGQLDRQVGTLFAQASHVLLQKAGLQPHDVSAIGSHGQTVRHQPNLTHPFTLQIGDPNVIAAMTGITTIADFRRRDMICGGQGAPLTPAFHQIIFRSNLIDRVVVNIGGIANLTLLPANSNMPVIGFDCGPGNTLLDAWCKLHLDQSFDEQGAWASQGQVNSQLLSQMLLDPYFTLPAPKSTGREYFNLEWLNHYLQGHDIPPVDVQATLAQLTVEAILHGINSLSLTSGELLLCGGGAHNADLVKRLNQQQCYQVRSTQEMGVDPDWVEAIAFAWLARQTLSALPGNLPEVTGAAVATVLGGIFLANSPTPVI